MGAIDGWMGGRIFIGRSRALDSETLEIIAVDGVKSAL